MKTIILLALCIAVESQFREDFASGTVKHIQNPPCGDSQNVCREITKLLKKYVIKFEEYRHVYRQRNCSSDSDCGHKECCIQESPNKSGHCKGLGWIGRGCSEFNMCARTPDEQFCPCREYLDCKPNPDGEYPPFTCQW